MGGSDLVLVTHRCSRAASLAVFVGVVAETGREVACNVLLLCVRVIDFCLCYPGPCGRQCARDCTGILSAYTVVSPSSTKVFKTPVQYNEAKSSIHATVGHTHCSLAAEVANPVVLMLRAKLHGE